MNSGIVHIGFTRMKFHIICALNMYRVVAMQITQPMRSDYSRQLFGRMNNVGNTDTSIMLIFCMQVEQA